MTLTLRLDGSTCRTPSEHRAIVARSGARRGDVLAWPTAERLRHDRHRLGLLVRWRDLLEPPRPVSAIQPGDDSVAPRLYRTDQPTDDQMLAAAGRGPYVVTRRDRRGSWRKPVRHPAAWEVDGTTVRIGELVFVAGELVRYGFDQHGRPLTPHENLTRADRSASPIGTRWRKALRGSADGAKLGTGVVAIVDFGEAAEAETHRGTEAHIARKHVGPWHAEVLDLSIGSSTAEEIGERFGHHGKYAERKGIRLVNEALDAFGAYVAEIQLAADNDNEPREYLAAVA